MLRSYDSRKEPPPEFDCTIWEAGRATCAIGLAFKPIQIGQSVFHDDGTGTFNPAPEALDEAVVNEWPGRDVGVFVSVGTGKRPKGSDANQTMWYEGFMGEFAEARRRLISKIEGCEKIHEQMQKEYLAKRGVSPESYFRFNVEIGVGEFGMNEWNRLADISGGTRRYMSRREEQHMVQEAAAKLAKVHRASLRFNRMSADAAAANEAGVGGSNNKPYRPELSMPLAVELPGDFPTWQSPVSMPMPLPHRGTRTPPSRSSYESGPDQLAVPTGNTPSPRSSGERLRPVSNSTGPHPSSHTPPMAPAGASSSLSSVAAAGAAGAAGAGAGAGRRPGGTQPPQTTRPAEDPDRLMVTAPTPAQYSNAAGTDKIAIVSHDEQPRRQQQPIKQSHPGPRRIEPPPLPPKTPLPEHQQLAVVGGARIQPPPMLPYPLDDEAPPPVNMARKPEYRR
jgi:hypothetical protein